MGSRETYRGMAKHYDAWQMALGGEFSKLISPRLDQVLSKHRLTRGRFLDLGCGTGSLLALYRGRNWRLAGVDASPEMLAVAEPKLRGDASLVVGRLDAVPLRGSWDVVTCFYDTLNHLADRDELAAAFREVSRLISPKGVFVFDTNNRRCYQTLWRSPSTVTTSSVSISVTPHFDDSSKIGRAVMSISPNSGTRITADLRERCFDDAEVVALLGKASLIVETQRPINPFAPGDIQPIKTFWVARRA